MKSILLVISLLVIGNPAEKKKGKDLEKISEAIHHFVSAADQRNSAEMDKVLHKDFRAVVNRLFGSTEVSIMNKTLYLDLLKQGKIGGDNRTVEINSVNLEGNNAVVRASFSGKELKFNTFIQLVKDTEGHWSLISDMPLIEKK